MRAIAMSKVPGRAHTLEQKRVMLDAVLVAWSTKNVDQQRLGQMLMNARPPRSNDVFYLEDEDVLCALLRLAGASDAEVGVWVQQFRAAGEEAR